MPSPDNTNPAPTKPLLLLAENRYEVFRNFLALGRDATVDYDLLVAQNEKELQVLLSEQATDLLMLNLDIFPLDKEGLQNLLKEYPANLHVPVLFYTQDENSPLLQDHMMSGLVDFLIEPISPIEMRARIRTYLSVIRLQQALRNERDELMKILHSVVPNEVVQRFLEGNIPRPKMVENVLVMFTDFVQYTKITQTYGSKFSFENVNNIFAGFDRIMEAFDLECIKVIGDAYMISGNVHEPKEHLELRGIMAGLKMIEFLKWYNQRFPKEIWRIRVGMFKGPVMAGFSRSRRLAFDLWGNTVNLASRLETLGSPGKITIGPEQHDFLSDLVEVEDIGDRIIDNWGIMNLFLVNDLKASNCPHELLEIYQNFDVSQILEEENRYS